MLKAHSINVVSTSSAAATSTGSRWATFSSIVRRLSRTGTTPILPCDAVDALMTVAQTYLAHHDATRPGSPRTQIVLHLDEDPLAAGGLTATLDDGTRVSAETWSTRAGWA
jgi:hypothetical protein